jgi:hypothetical protein
LQHERPWARRLAIVLAPPGNIARELSLYRRLFFSAIGEATARAFPEIVFLSWSLSPDERTASPRSPGRLRALLASCWLGVEGAFLSTAPVCRRDLAYLGLSGPVDALVGKATHAASSLGLRPDPAPPLDPGIGFFLFRGPDPRDAIDRAGPVETPRISFLDCSLELLSLEADEDPFRAASWTTLARSRRSTGA